MKRILAALFSVVAGSLIAQSFELPAEEFPFYQVLEWKGQGAILLNRDPSFNQKQVHMTLVGTAGKSTWQQVFNPDNEKGIHYISEDGGRYAYFLEYLEPKAGKIAFSQLNVAGNIKSNTVNFSTALKKLGDFQPDDLRLLDIVTTEKALVYLFTHTDNSKNKLTTIAVSMTHHNFLVYAAIVAENVSGSSRIEDQVSWYIAGEAGESIVYAARLHAGKDAGWLVKQFSIKGIFQSEQTFKTGTIAFAEHERVGFGTRGSALLNRVEPIEKGTLLINNGIYYIGGIEVSGSAASLVTYTWKNNMWNKVAGSPIKNYSPRKTVQVGYFPMKEGIGWYVKSGVAEGHFHSFTSPEGIVSGTVNQQTSNPGRLLTAEWPGKFVAALPGKWLVFDLSQLPGKKSLTFEHHPR